MAERTQNAPGQAGTVGIAGTLLRGKDSRIKNGAALSLVGLAAIADLFSLIPLAGDITGPLFWAFASVYLWTAGCSLTNGRRLAATLVSMACEMMPIIQELPMTMLGIAVVIALVRLEDRAGAPVIKPLSERGRKPLNREVNGVSVRPPGDA